MKFSTYFSKQARKPSGIFGRFYMSRIFDKGNLEMNSFVFEKLSFLKSDHILEIGCGTGQLLNAIAKELKEGSVEGIDFSKSMVSIAEKTNKKHIKNGKVKIHQGNFDDFPFEPESFDKIISVNTIYFWENPTVTISKIVSLLKPNGMLILGFHDKSEMEKMNLDNTIFELFSQQDVIELLTSKGKIDDVEILIRKGKGKTNYCAIGIK